MNYKKILLSLVICGSLFAGAGTVSAVDNSALIQLLLQQIAALQAQLTQLQAQQGTTVAWCHAFNTNMGIGTAISTSDLDALIMVLDKENIAEFIVINRPAEYNEIMAGGVVKLQAKYGILQTGYVGPITRTKLNALYGCGVTIVPTLPILPVVQPSVTVISPNGGESFTAGQSMNISWQNVGGAQSDVLKLTMVDYEGGNPAHIYNLATNLWGALPSNTQYYAYVIPSNIIPSSKLKIMVELLRNGSVVAMDVSNNYFSIVAPATATQPSITSINPPGGAGGNLVVITGKNLNASGNTIQYFQNGSLVGSQYPLTFDGPSPDGTQLQFTLSTAPVNNVPGIYQVRVLNSNGVSNLVYITILAAQTTPFIDSITPGQRGAGLYTVTGGNFVGINNITRVEFYKNGSSVVSIPASNISANGMQMQFSISGVTVANVDPGQYQVLVRNANGKSNSVNFTLTNSTTVQPSITVTSPNGGETYNFGLIGVNWTSSSVSNANIYLQFPDGRTCYLKTVPATQNSTSISVSSGYQCPNISSTVTAGQYKIAIHGDIESTRDFSNDYFNIIAPTVQPSATIMSGMQANSLTPTIFGTANGTSQIGVVLGSAGGKAYGSGLISVANGNWSVTVSPAITVGQYTVYIYDANNNQLTSSSLTVSSPVSVQPTITVTSPNGGEQWIKGSIKNITWTGGQNPNGSYSGVDITLYSAYCQDQDINCITASTKIITLGALVSNSYTWQVGEASSGSSNNVIVPGNYKVKVCSGFTPVGQERVCDISNNYFSIVAPTVQPSVTLLTPNGGQTYKYGDQITLSWQITGTVSVSDKLYLTIQNYGGGAGDGTIPVLSAPFVNNNFSYLYTIPTTLPAGSYYKVSVSGVINGVAVSDNSDSYFSIISQ
ncbi:MAG TPA: hypothetical protein VI937_00725 [Negativicutes bacterium]|nr:hypothetical protein [Negativicutes bacterium]